MTRVPASIGLAVAALVLLTGCGSVPDFSPGVAARVGDQTVSDAQVRDVASVYCPAVAPQLQGQPVPLSQVNARVAGSLTLRSAAEQFADDEGVTADASYQKTIDQADKGGQFKGLTDDQKDAVIEVGGAELYAAAVAKSVGSDGEKLFDQWLTDHDVEINPRYGVALGDGKASLTDTSLSYAVSDTATKAGADSPDATYVGALPATQRCG
ncbi:SurA N-terminal domain-containing protein [Nocardioides mangrovi]|uniref:SurA N-terminal domain-containing protein n=1 Tax=Nocardioides mangrovi TaxID=2874580 RepID=A0ABS7UFG4_9ACTN|nr:SurA N-terminal domain-containing protein [Nocardioides mangrovi]MBZ5739749.1 SurA N-terminal domain-containing protein [Nocardioides mangrovi]